MPGVWQRCLAGRSGPATGARCRGVAVLDIPADADTLGQARDRYGLPGAGAEGLVLVRPDGYVMGRWRGLDPAPLLAALEHEGLIE